MNIVNSFIGIVVQKAFLWAGLGNNFICYRFADQVDPIVSVLVSRLSSRQPMCL